MAEQQDLANVDASHTDILVPVEPRWRRTGQPWQFTGEELLDDFNRGMSLITSRQLRHWTEIGLVPKPERRVPPGATDGIVRALYPWWTIHVLFEIFQERSRGVKLAELRQTADERIARWRTHPLVDPAAARAAAVQIPPALPKALQRAVWDYLGRYAQQRADLPSDLHVVIALSDGHGFRQGIDIPPPPPPRSRKARGQ